MQVHEAAPGRFNPTTSDRVDKMYKEVSRSERTAKSDLTGLPLRPLLWGSLLPIQPHVALVKLPDDHAGARVAGA